MNAKISAFVIKKSVIKKFKFESSSDENPIVCRELHSFSGTSKSGFVLMCTCVFLKIKEGYR